MKDLFNGSIILAFVGMILMFVASPETTTEYVGDVIGEISQYSYNPADAVIRSCARGEDLLNSNRHQGCSTFPYSMSMVGLYDVHSVFPYSGNMMR
ncbi:MAG: hypothetical protein ACPGXY_00720 [Alphaproteobacteria bacterium]